MASIHRTALPPGATLAGALVALLWAGTAAASTITIVEFYNTTLKHYVLITDPAEVAAIEAGAAGPGWQRTGGTLRAYSAIADAADLVPVCRFYGNVAAGGPNSHFYTAVSAECAAVKLDPGWHYEGISFYAALPVNGACRTGLVPVWRAYNNGFKPQLGINDGNHRFSVDRSSIQQLVAQGWADEGNAFCVPGGTAPGTTSAGCMIPSPGFSGRYSMSALPTTDYRIATTGTAGAPIDTITMIMDAGTSTSATPYQVTTGANGNRHLAWSATHFESLVGGVHTVSDISLAQALELPMQPGRTQQWTGPLSINTSITGPDISCATTTTGTHQTAYTFVGIESVTVPAGTFTACRFDYDQTQTWQQTGCAGTVNGSSAAHLTIWSVDGLGRVRFVNNADNDVYELLSYTH